ncbi:MAG: hypothetical protein DMD81_12970 [Candidatus Rokuibacteriota bacterium]|nr:MAG: hypothetical protein DMD81_12970 [Candidatus Rokubacteria bacterium]
MYGVSPGERVVVAAADDRGIDQALELQTAGVNVVAVLDTRAFAETPALAALRASGTTVMEGHTVIAARGPGRVAKVIVGDAHGGPTREIECDLVALAGGFEPAAGLIGQAGGRLRALADGRPTLDALPAGVLAAGEVAGLTTLAGVIASGQLAGAEAALAIRGPAAGLAERVSTLRDAVDRARTDPLRAYVSIAPGAGAKRFVCLCEDVTDKDLRQAVAEGFDHIETLKRYSTVTMGPCQGKMCHRLSIDVCAHLTGRTPEETGATTARPPAQPVPLGALAARSGDPWKLTAMHHHHVDAAARLMDMGPWKRPLAYPMRGVGEGGSAVDQECRAVHERVGLIDVSTLGKLEIVGRDAAAFLDWLHPNRFSDMKPGRVRYRIMCDDAGIVLDDGVVARLAEDRFLLTTGTGTIDAIEQWFEWW